MTDPMSPRDAGMPQEVATAIARCHEWLNSKALLAKVMEELSADQRTIVLENCRQDPRLLVALGPPAGEDPSSKTAAVRELLRELIAAKEFDELPDLRRAAHDAGLPGAVLLDDDGTRKALPLLEEGLRGLALLKMEAEQRLAALPMLGCASEHPSIMLDLVQRSESLLHTAINHARGAMGADPPRGVGEFKTFRAWWAVRLRGAGFAYGEIVSLLGYDDRGDPDERLRLRDAIRKNCKRACERS